MNGATTLPCATTNRPPTTTSTVTSGSRKIFLRWRASPQICCAISNMLSLGMFVGRGGRRDDEIIFRQEPEHAVGHQLVAFRGPMRARRRRIGGGAVEGDERNSAGLQMPDQSGIAQLQTDQELGAAALDEIADLVDQLLGRI